MGTNYYVVPNRPSTREPIHIGKSSYGWLFCFQSQNETWYDPPIVWNTYDQVKDWLYKYTVEKQDFVIMNEYDEIVPYETFIKIVDDKQKDPHNIDNPNNFSYSKNVNGYRFNDGYFS